MPLPHAHDKKKLESVIDLKGFRVGDRSRGRYATPADFPLHYGTPYRGLHVRRWGLGFVHRFKGHSLSRRATRYDSQLFHRCGPRRSRWATRVVQATPFHHGEGCVGRAHVRSLPGAVQRSHPAAPRLLPPAKRHGRHRCPRAALPPARPQAGGDRGVEAMLEHAAAGDAAHHTHWDPGAFTVYRASLMRPSGVMQHHGCAPCIPQASCSIMVAHLASLMRPSCVMQHHGCAPCIPHASLMRHAASWLRTVHPSGVMQHHGCAPCIPHASLMRHAASWLRTVHPSCVPHASCAQAAADATAWRMEPIPDEELRRRKQQRRVAYGVAAMVCVLVLAMVAFGIQMNSHRLGT
jgi:hypothetical protein